MLERGEVADLDDIKIMVQRIKSGQKYKDIEQIDHSDPSLNEEQF